MPNIAGKEIVGTGLEMAALNNLAGQFADVLYEWLTEDEWEEMKRRNRAETNPNICHSHDFCDANMAMDEAFRRALGRSCRLGEEGEDDDMRTWSAAWDIARKGWLS